MRLPKSSILFFLSLFIFSSMVFAEPPAGYGLVWSDEFDGPGINTDYWNYDVGGWGWGNNEAQYYTDGDNFHVENGVGILTTRQESVGGKSYTSCRIVTQGKVMFQYGYIEARMKGPEGKGLWPAFWTLGANFESGMDYQHYYTPPDGVPWCQCGEMEIYETRTGPNEYAGMGDNAYIGTCHYDNNGVTDYNTGKYEHYEKLSADFHLYAMEWDETSVKYFFNGNQFWEFDITDPQMSEMHQEHFLLANIAVGGDYQGHDIDNSIFPQTMEFDYIRWYQDGVGVVDKNYPKPLSEIKMVNADNASLKVYNLKGAMVADLSNKVRNLQSLSGVNKIINQSVGNGIYLVRLFNGEEMLSRKVNITE